MRDELERAVYLRESGRAKEARELLLKLVAEKPSDPQINYQCAWVHDLLGREQEAVPFYERAIEEGLSGELAPTISLGTRCTNLEVRPDRGSVAPAPSAGVARIPCL